MQASSLSCKPRKSCESCLISNRLSVTSSWIGRPEPHARLLLDHDPFSVAEVTQLRDFVPACSQRLLRITRQTKRLADELIREPLVMNAWEVDRLLNIHLVVDHVCDNAQHRVDDRWSTRTAHGEPQAPIFTQHDRRCHRGERALLR